MLGTNLKVSTNLLENINKMVSFDAPKDQKIQYQLYKQKEFFDTTIVSFYQTYHNLPVWEAGLSVTVEKNLSVQHGLKQGFS